MEKFADIIKVFLEKHLLPTVLAVVGALISTALIPTDYLLIKKLGLTMFEILAFCICFVLIEALREIFKIIKNMYYKHQNKVLKRKRIEEENKKSCENLWEIIDNMSIQDYEYLLELLKTNNEPITVRGDFFGGLFSTNWVHQTIIKTAEERDEYSPITNLPKGSIGFSIPHRIIVPATKQYILKDDIYKLLRYSYDNYGKISNFSRNHVINKEEQTNGQP